MDLLFFILLLMVIFIALLFLFSSRINLVFNSDKSQMDMTLFWLDPFINAFVTIEKTIPLLKVYLFKQLLFTKTLEMIKNKHGGMKLIKLSNPKDVHVNVLYGFRDPFTTGITCGAINIASQFINIDTINQTPDFTTANDYINLVATAKVNLGKTLINLIKSGRIGKGPKTAN